MSKAQKDFQTLAFSVAGLAVMGVLLVMINIIANGSSLMHHLRGDFTADKVYTLSDGSKKILQNLPLEGKEQVQVRYYCSRGKVEMPIFLKSFAKRVDDLLKEYEMAADGKVNIERLNPLPFTNDEDKATLDGIDGQMTQSGNRIYFGIAITFIDQTIALPVLAPQSENTLEYDLTHAIYRVTQPEKATVGVMSSLPIMGSPGNPMMGMQAGGQAPWQFVVELKKNYEVREVDFAVEEIPSDIKILILLHPKDITEATEYAIDQFVVRGGKLIAFVDPVCAVEKQSNPANAMRPQPPGSSTLKNLFEGWGIEFDNSKIVMDMHNPTQMGGGRGQRAESRPAVLSLSNEALDKADITTNALDLLIVPYTGVFTGEPAEGLERTILMRTSSNSMLVDAFKANFGPTALIKDFEASDKQHAIAIKLIGMFNTAFPEGAPSDGAEEDAAPGSDHIASADEPGAVILFGDADMLYNDFWVQKMNFFGQQMMQVVSDNNNLLQNAVEQLSGDSSLIAIRSRTVTSRPFKLIKEAEAEAEKEFRSEMNKLEEDLKETRQKLNDLRRTDKEKGQKFVRSADEEAEIKKFRKKEVEASKKMKELQKQLTAKINFIEIITTWTNILAMPTIVALLGLFLAVARRRIVL
jgi:ABC-type uncharacterized transport system involved in gliding motility auxiliary subunit